MNAGGGICYSCHMDAFAIGYYGIICGLLAYAVPLLNSKFRRLLFGICTGLIAATLLPFVRASLL